MKNKSLILLELRKLWGINALRHSKDRKGYRIMACVEPLLLSAVLAFYLGGLCYGLLQLGMTSDLIQTFILFVISSMMLMLGFFRTGAQLFSGANFDILISMPVEPIQIISARWLRLYLEELPMAVLSLIVSQIVLVRVTEMDLWSCILPLVSALFLPLIPIAISGFLSTFTERLAAGKRCHVVLSATLSIGELLFIGAVLNLVPIFAMELSDHLIYWGLSLILTSLVTRVAANAYFPILTSRKAGLAHKQVEVDELQKENLHRSLVRREWKQYLSHGTYVSNTVVGPIMAVVVSAGMLFTDLSQLRLPVNLDPMLPFLPAMILAMMNPAACSISIEGKHWWILKAMPLSTRDIVWSKIRVGITLPLLSAIIASGLLIVRNHQSATQILTCLLLPTSATLFSAVWGLTANFRFPNFYWEDDVEVVKQGAASFVGGMVPCLLVLACGGLAILLPDWGGLVVACMLLVISVFLLQVLYKQKLPD